MSGSVGVYLEGISKRFKGGVDAIKNVTLDVQPGEFIVLVGPSGCGKSTLLRTIAGLEEVTRGRVYVGDDDVTTRMPQHRDVAMVFQSYALYPRMNVRGNIGFGLRMRRVSKEERNRRIEQTAEILGLERLLDRRPAELSGGQRQRVAMGRAIVREPTVFLLDEPLSNLDAKLRVSMRAQLTMLHKRLGVTTVYVTHDQVEAMTLGQRVAVLRDGELQQFDTPQELFHHPVNLFVAAFIGSPPMNFVQAAVADGKASFAQVTVPVPSDSKLVDGEHEVVLGLRPTGFVLGSRNDWPELTVTPAIIEELGDERFVIFQVDAPRVDTEATRAAVDLGATDEATLLAEEQAQFTARLPADAPVTVGEPITLSIDPGRVHFFDTDTGDAIV